MIALLQRVCHAAVQIGAVTVGGIGPGLLVFVGIQRLDDLATTSRLLKRVLGYRVFADAHGRMNCSLQETGGGLLLVPQFTLAADTRSGTRPSFTAAAQPVVAQELFNALVQEAEKAHPIVVAGRFGEDMAVSLVNDGPVTFWLQVSP